MTRLTRNELESLAISKAPAALAYQLRDTLEETPDDDLQAIINGNLFLTNDGYLLMLHDNRWTNGDST